MPVTWFDQSGGERHLVSTCPCPISSRGAWRRTRRRMQQRPTAQTSRSFQRLLTCEKMMMPASEAKPTAENQYQTWYGL